MRRGAGRQAGGLARSGSAPAAAAGDGPHASFVFVTLALPDDEVHVYCGAPADLALAGQADLTADEIERMNRFVFERDREIFLATRILVRTTLSRYQALAPSDWRFVANDHGRPEIAEQATDLRFNLSNTRGLVVCAVARDRDVGVDVERIARSAPLDVADRFFAPVEVVALRALAPSDQGRRFFDYWTLKESYIKARGLGLALPLAGFAFRFAEDGMPSIEVDPSLGDDGSRWQFEQRLVTAEHLVAVCARTRSPGQHVSIRWRWV
jgi:4'-phosphopantetheinyl transferase